MKKTCQFLRLAFLVMALSGVLSVHSAIVITSVVETGGDGTVTAKYTGQSFTGIAPLGAYTVPPYSLLAKCFVDRTHAHTNASGAILIPSYLLGNDYILTRNDNRENTGFRLDVSVSQEVLVYMLVDNRIGDSTANNNNPPFNGTAITAWTGMTWMNTAGFRPVQTGINRTSNSTLPDEVGIDENADGSINTHYSVYSNRYPAGTFSLNQQGLAGNNMYAVVVQAVGPSAPPGAPSNITAINGDAQVTLSWSPAAGASGYNIFRSSTSGSGYAAVGSVAGTTFVDSPLANGVDYFYVLTATNVLGTSTNSLEVVGHPNPVVTGLTAVGGTNQIIVSWSALANAETYAVFRAIVAGGPYTNIASGIAGTTYTDATPAAGRNYFYRIEASITGAGLSGQSATVSAATAPNAPTASLVSYGSTGLFLRWTNSDPVLSQFAIERSLNGSDFSVLGSVAANQRTYLDSGLALGTTYYYRIQATNSGGYSSYSATVSKATPSIAGYHINFGSGGDASAGTLNSPTPVGYLNDIGELFGDRTNTFFYGWTNAGGTNITRDARYRLSAGSPDLRYDTFNHMQKSPGGATWDFQLPNGNYSVRVVGGDPDNTDSTFQVHYRRHRHCDLLRDERLPMGRLHGQCRRGRWTVDDRQWAVGGQQQARVRRYFS